jgi:hypothetical protein
VNYEQVDNKSVCQDIVGPITDPVKITDPDKENEYSIKRD